MPRVRPTESLPVPAQLGGNSVANQARVISMLAKENAAIAAVYSRTDKALWTSGFAFPVASTTDSPLTVTDPYGYNRDSGANTITHKGVDFHAPRARLYMREPRRRPGGEKLYRVWQHRHHRSWPRPPLHVYALNLRYQSIPDNWSSKASQWDFPARPATPKARISISPFASAAYRGPNGILGFVRDKVAEKRGLVK